MNVAALRPQKLGFVECGPLTSGTQVWVGVMFIISQADSSHGNFVAFSVNSFLYLAIVRETPVCSLTAC